MTKVLDCNNCMIEVTKTKEDKTHDIKAKSKNITLHKS